MFQEKVDLTENARKVLEKRYLIKNEKGEVAETPEQLFKRVAGFIAGADKTHGASDEDVRRAEEQFYNMMTSLEFMPNSPTLMNAGRELGQLSACFVLSVDDSMEDIFEAIKSTALIHKSGGGTGFSFSRLRPKSSPVKSTGGVSSGPVSFMKVFNAATEAVKQGGTRRGANMGALRVDHPDIVEFISCKADNKDITNFNISVVVTDDFMSRVERDEMYDLIDPYTKKAVKSLKAKEVFDLIVKMAWKNGEPGIIFIDRMNEFNPTPKAGMYESTNPCITADSLIPTERGLITIGRLAQDYPQGGIGVLNSVGFFKPTKIFSTGIKEVFKIKTKAGYELKATREHPILTKRGWIKVKDLETNKDEIQIQSSEGKFSYNKQLPFNVIREYKGKNGRLYKTNLPNKWSEDLGILSGWLIGDGNLHGKEDRVFFYFGKDDLSALNKIKKILKDLSGKEGTLSDRGGEWQLTISGKLLFKFFENLGLKRVGACGKSVPETLFTAPEEAVKGFLKGIFSSDGTINYVEGKSSYVRLSSGSLKLLKQVQILLINLEIFSRIYENRKPSGLNAFNYITKGGEKKKYQTKAYHELEISRQDVVKFINKIGFIKGKNDKKIKLLLKKNERKRGYYKRERFNIVTSIEPDGIEKVYDLTEPITHSFIGNGITIHNCGEQVLLPYESCNLGSINLSMMIRKRDGKFEIDWEKLGSVVDNAVHFLDNVIDRNKFPLPAIEKATLANRKIGLGVMGWADLLIMLGIPYNSEDAIDLAEDIMKFIHERSMGASRKLAEVRGPFPNFKMSVYYDRGEPPIRNATTTTIAPTGTISIIAGSCSSGIEPLFALSYYRQVMDNNRLVEINPYFENVARERGFFSRELLERIAQKGSIQNFSDIPEDVRRIFVVSHDITPQWHVRMQAAFQKYTDNAVSKTVNFPNEATERDVEKAYKLAYKLGCKGVTIYRDRSREEQVLNIAKPENRPPSKIEAQRTPRKRPSVTKGKTIKIGTGCGNLYITINEDEEGLCEVFSQMGKSGGCAASQSEATSRLVSLTLRSGITVEAILKQLRGIRCPSPLWTKGGMILSCPDAIAKAIEKYLEEKKKGNNISMQKKELPVSIPQARMGNVVGVCPDCGNALIYSEGCMTCIDSGCGYSKCS